MHSHYQYIAHTLSSNLSNYYCTVNYHVSHTWYVNISQIFYVKESEAADASEPVININNYLQNIARDCNI